MRARDLNTTFFDIATTVAHNSLCKQVTSEAHALFASNFSTLQFNYHNPAQPRPLQHQQCAVMRSPRGKNLRLKITLICGS